MADLKFKSKVRAQAGLALPAEIAERALVVDANGDIKASAVTSTELGHLSGITSSVQTQIGDIATDVADLVTLSGVAANSADLGTFTGTIIPDASTVKSALQSLESEIEAIPAPFFYAGNYDASTNTPDLVGDAQFRVSGAVYRTSVAGTQDFLTFGGVLVLKVGDKVVYNGVNSVYEKWDVNDGDINSDDLTEGVTNLFFTDERAQDAVGGALGSTDSVQFTYNDAADSITANVQVTDSIVVDALGLKLSGDAAAPGNDKYYGTNDVGTKGFFDLPTGGSANDIQETSIALADNQVVAADVTGLLIAAGVRGFKVLATVEVDATLQLFETVEIIGVRKAAGIEIAQSAVGDESGVVFTITSGGQVQYTSAAYAGFVAGAIKFRMITLSA